MEASEMVAIPDSEPKESPQSTMAPDLTPTGKEGETTNVKANVVTNEKNVVEENKDVPVHNRQNVITQTNGIKHTKVSVGKDLKK